MIHVKQLQSDKNIVLLVNSLSDLCTGKDETEIKFALRSVIKETMETLWKTPYLIPLEFANVNCSIVKAVSILLFTDIEKDTRHNNEASSKRNEITLHSRQYEIIEQEHSDYFTNTPKLALEIFSDRR
jgi:hypothetical protein